MAQENLFSEKLTYPGEFAFHLGHKLRKRLNIFFPNYFFYFVFFFLDFCTNSPGEVNFSYFFFFFFFWATLMSVMLYWESAYRQKTTGSNRRHQSDSQIISNIADFRRDKKILSFHITRPTHAKNPRLKKFSETFEVKRPWEQLFNQL